MQQAAALVVWTLWSHPFGSGRSYRSLCSASACRAPNEVNRPRRRFASSSEQFKSSVEPLRAVC
eukprot:5739430-Alexandrium_andersonii.AAC.1